MLIVLISYAGFLKFKRNKISYEIWQEKVGEQGALKLCPFLLIDSFKNNVKAWLAG